MSALDRDREFDLDRRRVAASFTRAADSYDQHAALQQAVGERIFERLDVIRIDPERILDAGSGTGTATRRLARRFRGAEIVELDLALGMLLEARRRQRWFSRERRVCADMTCLPFRAGSFEFVHSNLALQWCPEVDSVFHELRRVLRDGGLVLFSTLGPDTLKELRHAWRCVDGAPHVHGFIDMHDLGDALIRAGFSSPVLDVENIELTYATVAAMLADLKGIGARNAARGRAVGLTGKQVWRRFVDAYEAQRRDGRIPATFEVIYAHAWAAPATERPQDGSTVAASPLRFVPRKR